MRYLLELTIFSFAVAGSSVTENFGPDQVIQAKLREVRNQVSAHGRASEMKELVSLVENLDREQVDRVSDESIDGLSDLLLMDDEVGAYYGALALGRMSCRAKRALPQLEKVLTTYKSSESNSILSGIGSSVSAKDELVVAVRDIRACLESSPAP